MANGSKAERKPGEKKMKTGWWDQWMSICQIVLKGAFMVVTFSPRLFQAYLRKKEATQLFKQELLQSGLPPDVAEQLTRRYGESFSLTLFSDQKRESWRKQNH